MAQSQTLERQKLFEAIAFFIQNTRHCGLVKLFKLLYFLDMLHFRETGRSVTGLAYTALPYGPVPKTLYDETRNPRTDLAARFTITFPPQENIDNPPRTEIKDKEGFKPKYLTKREQRIASEMAEIFLDATADQISEISHARNGPWDLAKKRGNGKWDVLINYFDSINLDMGKGRSINKKLLRERFEEFEEARSFFNEKG